MQAAFAQKSRSRSDVFAHTSTTSEDDDGFSHQASGPWGRRPNHELRHLFANLERGVVARLDRIDALLRQLIHMSDGNGPSGRNGGAGGNGGNERDDGNLLLDVAMCDEGEQLVMAHLGSLRSLQNLHSPDASEFLGHQPSNSEDAVVKTGATLLPQAMHVTLRREWQREASRTAQEAPPMNTRVLTVHSAMAEMREDEEDTVEKPWYLLLPSSRFRLCWEFTTMLIIAHDMAVVPVALAFANGSDIHSPWLFWPFLLFWTLDIPLSFLTGYYKRGRIELRAKHIAWNYCKSWFVLDFAVVFSTWMDILAGEDGHGYLLGRVVKSCRVLRVAQSVKILRFAKMRRLTEELHDRVTSEYFHILISVAKLMITILWINHFIACAWWAVGANSPKDWERESWTVFYRVEDDSLSYQYLISLHWSLTQFTPAGMEVSAKNSVERVFSIVVLLFAMVAFSSFVSSITASITQLRQLAGRYDTNFTMLRTYLQSHGVKEDLMLRILHCVDYRLRRETTEIQESQVQFLQFLSKPLQMELSSHMYAPTLSGHPFFWRYGETDPVAMRHVCLKAVSQTSLSTEDMLFTEGSICEQMFYVVSGELLYSLRRTVRSHFAVLGPDDRGIKEIEAQLLSDQILSPGHWCCEMSMWCPWVHVGRAVAVRMSDVLLVDVEAFISVTSSFHLTRRFSAMYADAFAEKMAQSHQLWSDVSAFTVEELQELVQTAHERRARPASAYSASAVLSNSTLGAVVSDDVLGEAVSVRRAAPSRSATWGGHFGDNAGAAGDLGGGGAAEAL